MSFDAASFLQSQVTGVNDTKVVPPPVGEFTAVIEKIDARQVQGKKDPSKVYTFLEVTWDIDDANVKALLSREKVTVRQSVSLDFNEQGGLDMGKGRNIGLGRLREATGLNAPGVPFSFDQLAGRLAKVRIKHRVEGEDTFAEVDGVAKA